MDTLTHIVIGGCLGEAFARRTLGKKAMFLGAVAHSIPDIDVITYTWMGTPDSLLSHRGFTHSFLFFILLSGLFAWIIKYRYQSSAMTFLQWMTFFGVMRFGQITGWENPRGRFAFHYFLQYPEANRMVVQRGRFSGWNKQSFNFFINRVTGNKAPTTEVIQ